MAYAKKHRRIHDGGMSLKTPRTPVAAYRYAINSRRIILATIIIVVCLVAAVTICSFFLNPEKLVPQKFESLARYYYEDTFYEEMINSDNYSGDPEKALSEYKETGLAPVTLRGIYLMNKENGDARYLLNYCDGEETVLRFFPEPPYARDSYRVDYSYSCNF